MSNVLVDDPSLMLNRSLDDVSDFLQVELDERIKNGDNSSNLQKMLENSKENGYDIMIKYQNESNNELFSFSILPYEV